MIFWLNIIPAVGQEATGHNVVVIDPSLPSVDILTRQITPGSRIVYLRKTTDPIKSITKILRQCRPVNSLHVFLEGRPGVFVFAGLEFDINSVSKSEALLNEWRNYFTDNGDIFLYGCEIGKGDKGIAFIRAMAMATGLDIAASDNLTGSDGQGGDWFLEVKSGTIENPIVVDGDAPEKYPAILRKSPSQNHRKGKESI